MHPGYIRMFADAKQHCNHLTVALHEDPSMARPHKLKPVQTVEERKEILKAIKYVDDVVVYQAEDTFFLILMIMIFDSWEQIIRMEHIQEKK